MEKFSHSKVECYLTCQYKFKLKYIDRLKARIISEYNDPRFLGTACHTGIETRSVEKAIENYKSNYSYITRDHEIEILKLSEALSKAIVDIPQGEYEKNIKDEDGFTGYIDCLVPVEDGVYDLLDFKYSNNVSKYKKSSQVHVYKYYFEKMTGNKIRDMYYVLIPKYSTKGSNNLPDSLLQEDIKDYYKNHSITFEKIIYDPFKVEYFLKSKDLMFKEDSFEKCPSDKCKWCEYKKFCISNGEDTSEIEKPKEKVETPEVVAVSLF